MTLCTKLFGIMKVFKQSWISYRMSVGNNQSFNFKGIRISDVVKILKDIDPKKATGWDTSPPIAFKMGSTELPVPLCDLYPLNRCIASCHWPRSWKRGEWVRVHKKNDRLDMENYGPVSVQTIINKVFEKLLANQITAGFCERLSDSLQNTGKGTAVKPPFLINREMEESTW